MTTDATQASEGIVSAAAPAAIAHGEFTPAPSTGAVAPGNGEPQISSSGFSPSQLAELAKDMVARGRLSQGEADAMLKAETGVAPPVALTPDQAAVDAMLPTPATAADFDVGPAFEHGDNPTHEQAATVGKTISAWLVDAQADRATGNFIIEECSRLAKETERYTEADADVFAKVEEGKLHDRYGDAFPAKLALARQFIAELEVKRPGLLSILRATGGANSALVVSQVIKLAEARQARGKRA